MLTMRRHGNWKEWEYFRAHTRHVLNERRVHVPQPTAIVFKAVAEIKKIGDTQ